MSEYHQLRAEAVSSLTNEGVIKALREGPLSGDAIIDEAADRLEAARAILDAIKAEIRVRREHARYKWEATREDDGEEGAFHEGRGHECDAILSIIEKHEKASDAK